MSNEKMGLVASVDAKLDAIGDKLKKKEWKVPTDLLGGVLFLIFGLVMLWLIPQQIEIKKKELVNGRAFPNLLMYVMIACSIILIVQQVIKLARRQEVKLTTVNLLVEVKAMLLSFHYCQCRFHIELNFIKLILSFVSHQVCICHPWNGCSVTAKERSGIP